MTHPNTNKLPAGRATDEHAVASDPGLAVPSAIATPDQPGPDTPVWIAAERRGIDAHELADAAGDWTKCHRSTRWGSVYLAGHAADRWAVRWCSRLCWIDGTPSVEATP